MRTPTHVLGLVVLLVFGPAAVGQAPDAPPPLAPERLNALEAQNRDLQRQLADIQRRVGALTSDGGLGAAGPGSPANPSAPGSGPVGPTTERELPTDGTTAEYARVDLSQGVRLSSADGRYRIEFHDLTQFDARFFSPSGTGPNDLHNTFDIPRQRLYFTGQVDKYFDFYSVINRGYGSLDILDSYVNFKFDPAVNLRLGRTKTPYGYEYYKLAEGDLIGPERSTFVGNLSPNRQIGAMLYGRLLDEHVEYALGVFNGPHRSFQDFNNFKNPILYVNTKPFLTGGSDLLRHLNVGGAATYGREDDPLEPTALRTANDETTTNAITNISPAFLQFNPNARQVGDSAFWDADAAWYYRSLTMLSMYNGGFITYAPGGGKPLLRVPYQGFSVAFTYFVTGEEIVSRKEVEPLREFHFRDPRNNPGAIEPYVRFAYLAAGQKVFSEGLADPNLWSRSAAVSEVGVNWYLNRYIRIIFDWQHSDFASPVQISANRFTNTMDLFWIRTQLYY